MGLTLEDILQVHDSEDIDLREWLRTDGRPQVEVIHYKSDGWDIEAILVLPASWQRKTANIVSLR